jgi:hypothetical protein
MYTAEKLSTIFESAAKSAESSYHSALNDAGRAERGSSSVAVDAHSILRHHVEMRLYRRLAFMLTEQGASPADVGEMLLDSILSMARRNLEESDRIAMAEHSRIYSGYFRTV